MKKSVMGLLFISLTMSLAGCGINSDKSPLAFSAGSSSGVNEIKGGTNAGTEPDSKFLSIKQRLFDVSCIRCHNPKNAKRLDLTTKENIIENFDEIIERMTTAVEAGVDYMPPKGDLVKPELIKELQAWKSDMQFSNIEQNLFAVSCLKCHGATQTKHINLTSKEVVVKNFDEIIYKMTQAFDDEDEPMPPKGKGAKVSPELIKQLQDWKASL